MNPAAVTGLRLLRSALRASSVPGLTAPCHFAKDYLGCGTIRIYGRGAFHPLG